MTTESFRRSNWSYPYLTNRDTGDEMEAVPQTSAAEPSILRASDAPMLDWYHGEEEGLLKCPFCPMTLNTEAQLDRHIRDEHQRDLDRP